MNLRIAYTMCTQLKHYVGPVGVYGDVNDILSVNLEKMKVRFGWGTPPATSALISDGHTLVVQAVDCLLGRAKRSARLSTHWRNTIQN